MNSTLRSLAFWAFAILNAVLVWNFLASTAGQVWQDLRAVSSGWVLAIGGMAVGVVGNLLLNIAASEVSAWIPAWVDALLVRAAQFYPEEDREQLLEEWRGELRHVPGGVWRLKFVLSLYLCRPSPAVAPAAEPRRYSSARSRWQLLALLVMGYAIVFAILTVQDRNTLKDVGLLPPVIRGWAIWAATAAAVLYVMVAGFRALVARRPVQRDKDEP